MVTHSSILSWKIPWTEETGRLQSMGCKELHTTEHKHTLTHIYTNTHKTGTKGKKLWVRTNYFLRTNFIICKTIHLKWHMVSIPGRGVGPSGHRPWPQSCSCSSPPPPLISGLGAWGSSSRPLPLTSDVG